MSAITLAAAVCKLDEIIHHADRNAETDPSQHAADTWRSHAKACRLVREAIQQEIGANSQTVA